MAPKIFVLMACIMALEVQGHFIPNSEMDMKARSIESWVSDTRWSEFIKEINFVNANYDQFQQEVNTLSDASISTLWDYCRLSNYEIDPVNLHTCLPDILPFDSYQVYKMHEKLWAIVDADGNNTLNYDEFKNLIAILAATEAGIWIKAFDANTNGLLEGDELTSFMNFLLTATGFNPTVEQHEAIEAAAFFAQTDADDTTMNKAELAKFRVQMMAIPLP